MYLGMSPTEVDEPGFRRKWVAYMLKSTNGWRDNQNGAYPDGFSAFPSGSHRHYGPFIAFGDDAYFWSSTESTGTYAWSRELSFSHETIGYVGSHKGNGLSVRCIKD